VTDLGGFLFRNGKPGQFVARADLNDLPGKKLFITNAVPGRTVGLACLIENKPAVLIAA
jgi:hypothetical protein